MPLFGKNSHPNLKLKAVADSYTDRAKEQACEQSGWMEEGLRRPHPSLKNYLSMGSGREQRGREESLCQSVIAFNCVTHWRFHQALRNSFQDNAHTDGSG